MSAVPEVTQTITMHLSVTLYWTTILSDVDMHPSSAASLATHLYDTLAAHCLYTASVNKCTMSYSKAGLHVSF